MREINIRQMSPFEARLKLESELNQAFMAGEQRVTVIHGIGAGVLKKLTHEIVAEYNFCDIFETPLADNPGTTQVNLYPPTSPI